jgi:superfamily II DNA or RNA helicase
MEDAALLPTPLRQLPEVTGHCLDALLVLGEDVELRSIRDSLTGAGYLRDNGRPYTHAQIKKAFEALQPFVHMGGQFVTISDENRMTGLAGRGFAENAALRKLATQRYREQEQPKTRSYYYYPDHATLAALALLADGPNTYHKHIRQLGEPQQRFRYAVADYDFLFGVLTLPEPDFWTWRQPSLQFACLAHLALDDGEDLFGPATDTALEILARQDFLDLEQYRPAELAGALLLHRVLDHERVRAKHFDLDLLARLLRNEEVNEALLTERIHSLEGQTHFIDMVFLAAAVARKLIDGAQLDRILRSNTETMHPAGLTAFRCWAASLNRRDGQYGELEFRNHLETVRQYGLPDLLVVGWVSAWLGLTPPQTMLGELMIGAEESDHLPWPQMELCASLLHLFPVHPESERWRARTQVQGELQIQSVVHWIPIRPRWESALQAVEKLTLSQSVSEPEAADTQPEYRTIWIVDFARLEAYAKEQKLGKKGYSKGRRLKWEELYAPHRQAFRIPEDRNTFNALSYSDGRALRPGSYVGEDYVRADFGQLLYELAGHPRVYLGERERNPVVLVREKAEVRVEDRGDTLQLRFEPPPIGSGHYHWKKITPTRYAVYELNDRQVALAKSIGYGLDVPALARERLEATLEGMRSDVTVQSDTDLLKSDLPVVAGSDHVSVHLLPLEEGYQVEFLARPVAGLSVYFPPGRGMLRSLIATEDGRQILERDLEGEQRAARALVADCPSLPAAPSGEHYDWQLEDERSSLHLLLELRKLVAAERCTVEYPKGQKLRLSGEGKMDDLSLRVGKQRDWFAVSGEVRLDENRVLDLQLLLQQLKENNGGFVKLQEGEFVAITEELRERIRQIEGLLHENRGSLQLPTLAANQFAEVAEGLEDVEFDLEWQQNLERIESARHLRPRPPSPFDAELRPYQREGYDWLMRLAAWGVGACLADDMGLGKTIQALAVLTARREEGPALVLAPASVIRNWRNECLRFAPALRPVLLAKSSDTHLIDQLGPGDVLLVSYGLITYVTEELAGRSYATVVLDEAQAIKNYTTKRARAVSELQADFRIATTGTPIENHLGELWSLFRFLNPGLLGGRKAFNEKYALPITRDDDAERREQLRRLVQPFILRRRKDEVLKELPAKTEVVLSVEAGPEERALYEAMRREALREIAEAAPEEKRFKVLAQLTRLRQAACHPKLVRPKSKIPSAKLDLVGDTIRELLDNGHKALVFSQFVKHLKLVEEWVQGQGIAYQYLDGSTPGKERERRVDAFHSGEGQLFLISLKAGGTGLNLTAADFVLHLDPWWNPAAEDQASDRAHRIGQQRPVTVYRFVNAGTIEEQVVALHADKRDLADQILAGTGRTARLEVDEILTMLAAG